MRLVLPALLVAVAAPLSAQSAPTLEDLSFMAGCWEGTFANGGIIEERYTPPAENVMLGTTRYLMGGRAVQFEFTAIRSDSVGIGLLPYPGGRPSPHLFRLASSTPPHQAVFEAPENDFPKRIVYRRAVGTPDTLVARIDNGAGSAEAQEWRMVPAACGGG